MGLHHMDVDVEIALVVPGPSVVGADAHATHLHRRVNAAALMGINRYVADVDPFRGNGVMPLGRPGTAGQLAELLPALAAMPAEHADRLRARFAAHEQRIAVDTERA